MFKKVSLLCLSMLIGVLCLSNTSNNDAEEVSYVEDGLVYDEDEIKEEDNQLLKYKEELQDYVHVVDNQIVVDYESIEKSGKFEGSIDEVRENVEIMNDLAEERPDIVTINQDTSLSFNIEDEYAEQWDGWYISWSLWNGWTWKLDSDFGKLAGIVGIVYGLMDVAVNGTIFYNKMLSITDVDKAVAGLSTIVYCLTDVGIKNVVKTYLKGIVRLIASYLVTMNLTRVAIGAASLGTGWAVMSLIDLIIGWFMPSLITSCSMLYNCFKYNAPIYFRYNIISAKYSLDGNF